MPPPASNITSPARHFEALDGLRGIAILIVLTSHLVTLLSGYMQSAPLQALHHLGRAGTDLSFLLSGFLIWMIVTRRQPSAGVFLRRRLMRLYPTFAFVMGLYLLACLAVPARSKLPADGWETFAYVLDNFSMPPGLFGHPLLNTASWTLGYEWAWYLTALVMAGACRRAGWNRPRRIVMLATASAALLGVCLAFGGPVRMAMFGAGALLYEMRAAGLLAQRSVGLAMLALSSTVAALALRLPPSGNIQTLITFTGFWIVVRHCLDMPRSVVAICARARIFALVGQISYPLYLSHGLVLNALFVLVAERAFGGQIDAVGAILLTLDCVCAALLMAWLLHVTIERPLSLGQSAGLGTKVEGATAAVSAPG